jgi:dihydroorotase
LFSVLPRDIFGLPQAAIAKGAAASLTLFVPDGATTLTKAQAKSASINNPFIGQPLAGRIAGIVNNNKVHLNN